jgi:hypothetical protein
LRQQKLLHRFPSLPHVEMPFMQPTQARLILLGDALHATDPSTVNLASGGLQFVEFFRFT